MMACGRVSELESEGFREWNIHLLLAFCGYSLNSIVLNVVKLRSEAKLISDWLS